MKPNLENDRFFMRLVEEGKLKITRSGRAFNLITGKELSKESGLNKYRRLVWQNPKTKKLVGVQLHRLVWIVFKGAIPRDLIINHVDGNKDNCRVSNLELTTEQGNRIHARDTGLNNSATFTDAQVRGLRRKHRRGDRTVTQIMEKYSVSRSTVNDMLSGRSYTHVS